MGIAVGDIIQATMQYMLDNEMCYVVLHYRGDSNLDGTKELDSDITDEVKAELWTGKHRSAASLDCTLTGIRVARVAPTPSNPYISLQDEAGTVADSALPGTNCALVAKYSSVASKNSRGRAYWPGLPETHVADGRIQSGADQSLWEAVATAMEANLEPANWGAAVFKPVVFSRKRFDEQASPYHYEISSCILRYRVATQRSRRTAVLGFS